MDIELKTTGWQQAIDITEQVQAVVSQLFEKEKRIICNKKSRACFIYCPHTTAGVTINEGFDKSVMKDVLECIDELTPRLDFEHREGNSPAHVKASLVGSSTLVPIEQGKLDLGQWQKIFFLEFDGPKERKIKITLL